MTTCADLIQRVRNVLLMGQVEEINQLAGSIGPTDATLTFTQPIGGITQRSKISMGLESMYVWSTSDTPPAATVLRGADGTIATSHAQNDLVSVNPKFPDWLILQRMNECIAGYEPRGFYQMLFVDLTTVPGVYGYDLTGTGEVSSIYKVAYSATGPENRWPRIRADYESQMPTGQFPSGNVVMLREEPEPGRTLRVWYKAPFTPFGSLADDFVTQTGMPANTSDIPVYGAAALLLGAREGKRSFGENQGDSRRATEVPPGTSTRASLVFAQEEQRRLSDAVRSLQSRYPDLKPAV